MRARRTWLLLLLLPIAAAYAGGELDGAIVQQVTWTGTRVTKDRTVSRELETRVGEALDSTTVQKDVQRLENLGIFADVQVVATAVDGGVAVEYRLVEMPSYIPYVAFKYTEENGFSIGPALSAGNLFGRDIALSGRALFGGTTTFQIELEQPWITGNHVSLNLTAARLVRDDRVRGFEETSWELTPWVGTYIGRHGRLAGTVSWFQMGSDRDSVTLAADNRDDLIRVGVKLGWDSRDSWRVPHHGWRNEIEAMKTGGFMGGDGDYWTLIVDLQRYQPVGRHTLAIGALTTLQTGTVGVDIPGYMGFTMGGANTIRGYDVEVLGRDIFGKNQLIGTVEYQHVLVPVRPWRILRWSFAVGLQAAAFADIGTAWNESDQFRSDRSRVGGGVGLRVIVPNSELIRLDAALGEVHVYFHFAPWAKFTAQRFRLR